MQLDIHKPFNNKMRKYRPLMLHPDTMEYIPDTDWYSEDALVKMLERHSTLFIKPNKGRIGIGVMRLRKLDRRNYELHYQDQSTVVHSVEEALQSIREKLNPKKKYIVQQGIDLATVLDRPFDFRVVMHKTNGEWQRTAWCVKISPPQLIVTNHARGGVIITVDQALKLNKHLFNYKQIMDQISEICFTICKVYDLHFSFCILGLDMAVDKNGHIWFIEANTSPDHTMFSKLGNSHTYKKLKKLDRKIRAESRRLKEELSNTSIIESATESNSLETTDSSENK